MFYCQSKDTHWAYKKEFFTLSLRSVTGGLAPGNRISRYITVVNSDITKIYIKCRRDNGSTNFPWRIPGRSPCWVTFELDLEGRATVSPDIKGKNGKAFYKEGIACIRTQVMRKCFHGFVLYC